RRSGDGHRLRELDRSRCDRPERLQALQDLLELGRVQTSLLAVMGLLLRVHRLLVAVKRRALLQIGQYLRDRQIRAHFRSPSPLQVAVNVLDAARIARSCGEPRHSAVKKQKLRQTSRRCGGESSVAVSRLALRYRPGLCGGERRVAVEKLTLRQRS